MGRKTRGKPGGRGRSPRLAMHGQLGKDRIHALLSNPVKPYSSPVNDAVNAEGERAPESVGTRAADE